MNRLRRWVRARQDGNAVLFSMIIIASAMTVSLGMASLVAGEVRSAGLVLPGERAYYKAESYVEQALWQKKQDVNFNVPDVADLNTRFPNFLCATAPCFTSAPTAQDQLLKELYATTSPNQAGVVFPADTAQQYDVVTTGVTTVAGTITFSHLKGEAGFRGLEVTVSAYSKDPNPAAKFPVNDPFTTAVELPFTPAFVDKTLVPASGIGGCSSRPTPDSCVIDINQGSKTKNPVGEPYPALDSTNNYRIRVKALGADAAGDIAVSSGSNPLTLRSPDFTVRSVAEDNRSRRGIQVLLPASEQVSSIFDFVLFSDLDLTKLKAKASGTKLITTTAWQDQNGNCTRDAADTPMPGVAMTAHPSSGPDSTVTTDATGVAAFPNLQSGATYTVTASLSAGSTACSPPGNPQTVTFANNSSNEAKPLTFLIKAPSRVPFYRFYNTQRLSHFYTTIPCTSGSQRTGCNPDGSYIGGRGYFGGGGWAYEFIAGYLYTVQAPGTQPLYQAFHDIAGTTEDPRASDYFYTMDKGEWDYWTAPGRFFAFGSLGGPGDLWVTQKGIAGYMYPYDATDDAAGRTGCPAGSAPLYRSFYISGAARDHLYTMNLAEWNSVTWYAHEGVTGCMWTTGN